MYFSISTIVLYVALISQLGLVSSAPVFRRKVHSPSGKNATAAGSPTVSGSVPAASYTPVASGAPSASGAPAAPAGGSGPKFVIYTDRSASTANSLPAPAALKGYTHLLLAFLLPTGPADQSQAWSSLSAADRKSLKGQYAAAGIKVMVSAFGGTSAPTTEGVDAAQCAQTMANFVKANDLDGIDIDYEDLSAFSKGTAVAWIETYMTTLRKTLPVGQFIVSHAPLAPHFSAEFLKGPYLQIDQKIGSLIDFYNVQFYNDGYDVYTDCAGLLTQSPASFPKSSLFEIAASGVSLNKLLIGKPVIDPDASNGYITPQVLGQCVQQAVSKKWAGGIMGWQFRDPQGAAAFIGPSLAAFGLSGGSGSEGSNGGGASGSGAPGEATTDLGSTTASTPDSPPPTPVLGSPTPPTPVIGSPTESTPDFATPTPVKSKGKSVSSTASPTDFNTGAAAESGSSPTSTDVGAGNAIPTSSFNNGQWTPSTPTPTDLDAGAPATSHSVKSKSKSVSSTASPTDLDTGAPTESPSVKSKGNASPTSSFNNGQWTPSTLTPTDSDAGAPAAPSSVSSQNGQWVPPTSMGFGGQ
ncbi:glycoside hydrolase superfamily [Gautieria morchelliformis]|nr:glycoside hydrolase superfamily [Gautieria morchelliformis]